MNANLPGFGDAETWGPCVDQRDTRYEEHPVSEKELFHRNMDGFWFSLEDAFFTLESTVKQQVVV